jgi:hypothetical protein
MAEKDFGPRIGADPEVFVQNKEGIIVPICGHIGGTKEKPIEVTQDIINLYGPENGARRGVVAQGIYAMQEDNVMLEFNIPAYTESGRFVESIGRILGYLEASILAPKELSIRYGVVDNAFKSELLESFMQSSTIGCNPDFNAYATDGRFQRKAFSAVDFGNRRFCGGHIHVQYNQEHVPPHIFAQFMDVVACLPYLSHDKQRGRRLFYGQPGLFRIKDYGIEYRTLSNFWLHPKFRERYLQGLAENVLRLAHYANSDPDVLKKYYSRIDWDKVQQFIKNEDSKKSIKLCREIQDQTGMILNIP